MARLSYAFRSLAKAPLLSLVVVLSLGLGIGANTAIFSLLQQVVLSNLPVQHPEQLALVTAPGEFKGGRSATNNSGGMDHIFSYPVFRELEKHAEGVAGFAGFRDIGANMAFRNQTVSQQVELVSGGYFSTLGVKPLVGRTISPDDDRTGAGNPVAVLGYGFWRDKLGGQPDVLNQPLRINGQVFTVVGVAPANFTSTTMGQEPAAYLPLSFKPLLTPNWNGTERWNDYWIYLFARLKPGQSRQQAAAALNSTYSGLVEQQAAKEHFRNANDQKRFRESRLSVIEGSHGNSGFRENARVPLMILMAATAMVLLIAMANAANLLLARSAERRRELAIRSALGAGQGELMGQLITEALLLAAAGGLAGLALGAGTIRVLIAHMAKGETVHYLSSGLDWIVLLFALALSVATGLLFGLYPAWDGARVSLATTLKDESGKSSSTHGNARMRRALVCAQVMISAVLLIPTGLFLKSLVNLLHVDLGMKTENVIGFSVSPALNGYKNEQCRALFDRMESELAAIPGVRGVATGLVPLIGGSNWGTDVKIEGASPSLKGDLNARFNEIGPGYFGKLGVPLMAGREFTTADTLGAPGAAIVNEQFVKGFLEGRNPIGLHFSNQGDNNYNLEIVGVVKDSHYSDVKQAPPKLFYTPWRQDKELGWMSFYVHSALPLDQTAPQIRRVMSGIDRDLPLEDFRTLDETVSRNIQNDRLIVQLAAAFAILATLLAMLGLYGVMAHSVTRRTREIGIRIALGAQPGRIRLMVMRELMWILGIGLALGIPAAVFVSRLTESQLYGVKARDITVFVLAVLVLAATAFAAGFWPARRASRVNPLDALRYE
jgi:putative ABC transport system permease protein